MAMVLSGMGEAARQAAFSKAVTRALKLADPAGPSGPLRLTPDQRDRLRHALVSPIEDSDVARQFMRWYESLLWDAKPPPYLLVKTIEHVLPRARDASNDWSHAFSDEAVHRRMSHMIGNFTLLDYDLNERAGRLSFERKKGVYREEPHEIRSLHSVCSEREWTARQWGHRLPGSLRWRSERSDQSARAAGVPIRSFPLFPPFEGSREFRVP